MYLKILSATFCISTLLKEKRAENEWSITLTLYNMLLTTRLKQTIFLVTICYYCIICNILLGVLYTREQRCHILIQVVGILIYYYVRLSYIRIHSTRVDSNLYLYIYI